MFHLFLGGNNALVNPTVMKALEFTPNVIWDAGFIGHNAYHGNFWAASATPGDCFWEAWVSASYGAEYFISSGHGGSHVMLLGFNAAASGKLKVTGNVYDGSSNISFTSLDGVDPNTWHHVACGVDHTGNFIYVYLDGVLTAKVAFTGVRTVGGSQADLGLYIGGSDHSNFKGKVLRVRGFENQIPFASSTFPASFYPETVFSSVKIVGTTEFKAQFLTDYSEQVEVLPDHSLGYNSAIHTGKLAIGTFGTYGTPSRLPQWVTANFAKPALIDTPESIPVGALVFDDFTRINQTGALFEAGNNATYPPLGSARTGQAWTGLGTGGAPVVGVLESSAVGLGIDLSNADYAFADANATNYTMTVTRKGSDPINVMLRRTDANNYYQVAAASGSLTCYKNVAGGGLTLVSSPAAPTDPAWTTLTIVVSGTTATITPNGGGGGEAAIDAALTGELVGFGITGMGRVDRFLVAP